ncbi:MAG: phosphatidylserine decarboxylase [Thermoanaerobaculia bacterium]|nr:phosphatidylserine decarboxylase [Thermoanaerobaculia bacterium]
MSFARESIPFVLPFALAALVAAVAGARGWAVAAAVVGLLVLLFFRDPKRAYAGPAETLVAPADGLVTAVDEIAAPDAGPGTFRRVVIFLSVFDVHVQRVPADAAVVSSTFRPGRKVPAFRPNADDLNAGHLSVLELPGGDRIAVRQVAGLLARRVVCYLRPGERRQRGERLGVIKFGSRVDLLVPPEYRILVAKGDRVRNGETPVAAPPAR